MDQPDEQDSFEHQRFQRLSELVRERLSTFVVTDITTKAELQDLRNKCVILWWCCIANSLALLVMAIGILRSN